ncbi:MAG: hypothetical protein M1536_09060 [Firmicutes bacterium]|nr:hypothetical protein [Bacillota bacterium]
MLLNPLPIGVAKLKNAHNNGAFRYFMVGGTGFEPVTSSGWLAIILDNLNKNVIILIKVLRGVS